MGWVIGWTGGCPVSGCLGGGTDGGFAPTVSGNFWNATTAWFTTAIGIAKCSANWIVGGADAAKLELSVGGCGKVDWMVCKAAPS